MKIFALYIILSVSVITCNNKRNNYQEQTTYLNKYFQKIHNTKKPDNELIFVMQPNSCGACSKKNVAFIQEIFHGYKTPQTFIINGDKKIDFLKTQLQQLPNSTIIIDSTRQIDRYGFLHVDDVIIEVESGEIILIESITDETFPKLKRRYKR